MEFEQVYDLYFQDVYRYIRRLSGSEHVAEEITSETFFKALHSIGKFRGQCDIRVWLCQIAKNTYFSLLKKQKRSAPLEGDWPAPADLEERLGDKEDALKIHQVLHRLAEPYREVFWLRTFGELSFAQIGGLFEKTESWARVTYHRARMKIKEALE
mgnify:CR=1 FL=1